jgi:hypothetical protein
MHLNQEDISLFFKLWYALIYSINCKHKIVPEFVERAVLMSWRANFVSGKFIIYKHLKKYTVFMSTDENPKLYGVIGISDPIEL